MNANGAPFISKQDLSPNNLVLFDRAVKSFFSSKIDFVPNSPFQDKRVCPGK